LSMGQDAYGVTDIAGGGLQTIVNPLCAGNGPLNQRATVGWKTMLTAKILVNSYMVRIESASTFTGIGNN
ncbi:MAG: N4-gp56 family major capsid protein, partial [Clostridia bacterium]|nr:N4-gp56 family major capsid protein [Clostridia bacterium]